MPTLTDHDLLVESRQILRHETLKLATSDHLDAVVQLVKEAKRLHDCGEFYHTLNAANSPDILAWLTSAEKVL